MTRASAMTLAAVGLAAVASPGSAAAQGRVEERRPIAPDASVRVHNLLGAARITGWDKDTIVVTASVPPGSGRFYFAASESGAKLGVELPLDESGAGPSQIEVHVPANARVWVKSASAEIEASGVTGSLDLNSVSGRIRVRGAPRELIVETMDGSVEVTGAARWTRIKTASGPIQVSEGAGEVSASTVSGAIRVDGGPYRRGRFESVVGDIRFDGSLDRAGAFHFESHSGNVELRLPADAAADFDIKSYDGAIENGLTHSRPLTGRDLRTQELGFAVGGGGAVVTIRTFKGKILLSRRR